MKNPLIVFLFSLGHLSKTVNKIYAKFRIYGLTWPVPFEHYCVFCAKHVCNDWWEPKSSFEV